MAVLQGVSRERLCRESVVVLDDRTETCTQKNNDILWQPVPKNTDGLLPQMDALPCAVKPLNVEIPDLRLN